MASFNSKITDDDRVDKGVSGLSDTPNLTSTALKSRFDSLANFALDRINSLIGELEATSAAERIGTVTGNLQAALNKLTQSITSTNTDVSNLTDRVSKNEGNISIWGQYISTNTRDITTLEGNVADLQTGLNERVKTSEFDSKVNACLVGEKETLDTKIDELIAERE